MTHNNSNQTKRLLMGLVIGGLVGSAAALILAPSSGRQLRKDIADKAEDILESGQEYFDKGKSAFLNESTLLWGSVAATLLGTVSGILLSPRASYALKGYLKDHYEQIYDHTSSLVNQINEKGQALAEMAGERTAEWAETALATADYVSEEVEEWADLVRHAAEKVQLEAQDGNGSQQHKVEELLEWANKAVHTVENVRREVKKWTNFLRKAVRNGNVASHIFENEGGTTKNIISEVADWAVLGFNVWQNIKNKR